MFECGHSLCCFCVAHDYLCPLCNSESKGKVNHTLNTIRITDPIFHQRNIVKDSPSKKDGSKESGENTRESKNEEICFDCGAVISKALNPTSDNKKLHKCFMIECPYSSMGYGCSKKYISNENFDTHMTEKPNIHIVSYISHLKKNTNCNLLDHKLIEENNILAQEIYKKQIYLFNKVKSFNEYRKEIEGSYPKIEEKDIQTYTQGSHTLCENPTDSKFYNVEVKALGNFVNIGLSKKNDSSKNYLLGICKYSEQEDEQIFYFDGKLMQIKFKINCAEKNIVFIAESAERNNNTKMTLDSEFKIEDFQIVLEAEDSYEISFF